MFCAPVLAVNNSNLTAVTGVAQEEQVAGLQRLGGRANARELVLLRVASSCQQHARLDASRLAPDPLHVVGVELTGGERSGPSLVVGRD